ncbi:hypothetical protein BJV74DRAFT_986557 [Russula compacta]|nr:hypothetical protein BJV74DRAFT_986557 [Russula compacta]
MSTCNPTRYLEPAEPHTDAHTERHCGWENEAEPNLIFHKVEWNGSSKLLNLCNQEPWMRGDDIPSGKNITASTSHISTTASKVGHIAPTEAHNFPPVDRWASGKSLTPPRRSFMHVLHPHSTHAEHVFFVSSDGLEWLQIQIVEPVNGPLVLNWPQGTSSITSPNIRCQVAGQTGRLTRRTSKGHVNPSTDPSGSGPTRASIYQVARVVAPAIFIVLSSTGKNHVVDSDAMIRSSIHVQTWVCHGVDMVWASLGATNYMGAWSRRKGGRLLTGAVNKRGPGTAARSPQWACVIPRGSQKPYPKHPSTPSVLAVACTQNLSARLELDGRDRNPAGKRGLITTSIPEVMPLWMNPLA